MLRIGLYNIFLSIFQLGSTGSPKVLGFFLKKAQTSKYSDQSWLFFFLLNPELGGGRC